MSREEDAFFDGKGPDAGDLPPPPRRRASALFARSPAIAVLALAVSTWLLWDLAPEVAYYFSAQEPIDLGSPGAYRLQDARENRLVQIRGELVKAVPVTVARTGDARTIGIVAGTNLVVDRPGRGGPPVYEGRLMPAKARADYAAAVKVMREKGAELGDAWLVLRDGERPRRVWPPVLGTALLLLIVAVNVRALVKALAS
ncbi:MAG: hypothetical protein U0229_00120 [Anaeromyxobacter sp.]